MLHGGDDVVGSRRANDDLRPMVDGEVKPVRSAS